MSCLNLTIWACSPHSLPKGKVPMSYSFPVIPYHFDHLLTELLPLMASGTVSELWVLRPWAQACLVNLFVVYSGGHRRISVCKSLHTTQFHSGEEVFFFSKNLFCFCLKRLLFCTFSSFRAHTKFPKEGGIRELPQHTVGIIKKK